MRDLFDFENGEDVLRAICDALRPEPPLTVSEWADKYRWLGTRASAEPGKYRVARTPYMREIMDCLSPSHPAQRVVFMKGAQVGASEAGNNWVGYVIHYAPGPMLLVQPTVELAKRFSRQRIDALIEDTPALRERVAPPRARDSGNTLLSKEFPGGILVITGANSAVGLRSMPARYLFLDEVDAYPASADDEGDPVLLAEERAKTFGHRRKIFLVSTPKIAATSRIAAEYEASDQRRYFVPCPHCGHMQPLEWERLRWEKGRPETAHYLCAGCERPIEEAAKTEMLAAGEWRATAEPRDPRTVGFHLSALYSPLGWTSWADIARAWERCATDEQRRVFYNATLGLPWQERGEAPDWERLYERREAWPADALPEGVLFLTAGADVQRDRIEVSVWGWGRGLESWLVDHVVLHGSPGDPEVWRRLDQLLARTWTHAAGRTMRIAKLAIDTGYETAAVYAWARRAGPELVAPVKGVEGWSRAAPVTGPTYVDVTEGGRRLRRGARLWTVATATFKAETYRWLRLPRPTDEEIEAAGYPAGYVHLPAWADAELVRQLVAEQLVTVRDKRGYARLEWQKVRERNEALDCRVYARAAAWLVGADRWDERAWAALERQLGIEPSGGERPAEPAPDRAAAPEAGVVRPRPRPRRRVRGGFTL